MGRETPTATRILFIANGNVLQCTALAELLAVDPTFQAVYLGDNANIVVDGQLDQEFDLLVFFAVYPVSTLAAGIRQVRNRGANKDTRILLVLAAGDTTAMHYLRALAVDGMISIAETASEFRRAIHTLAHDKLKYISPKLAATLLGMPVRNDPLSCLSKRELDVAALTVQGKSNTSISTQLNISRRTVYTYKARIYEKLKVDNDVNLVRFAFKNRGLFEEGFIDEGL